MRRFKRIVPGKATRVVASKTLDRIVAAGEDELDDDFGDDFGDDFDDSSMEDDFDDTGDDFSDTEEVEDEEIEDTEVEEDEVNIDVDNNIAGHYIAECDSCHGVFISATIESDQQVTKVSGVCPLCDKETDQYLKWVIKDAGQRESK